jgi:hypothetical protein
MEMLRSNSATKALFQNIFGGCTMNLTLKRKQALTLAAIAAAFGALSSNHPAFATTDDSAELQKLISAGGTVTLPARTFNVSKTIFIPSSTTVVGQGDTTVIKAIPPFIGTIMSFGTAAQPSSNSKLMSVVVDGSATKFSGTIGSSGVVTTCGAGPGIWCPPGSSMNFLGSSSNGQLEVRNCGLNGMGLHGLGTSNTNYAARVDHAYIHDNYAEGINVAGSFPTTCSPNAAVKATAYNVIQNNQLYNNDKADAGSSTKHFHAINIGNIAAFTTVSSNTLNGDDVNVGDNGKYDSALSSIVPSGSPVCPQGNKVLSNIINSSVKDSYGDPFIGIRVNGNEFQTSVDGNYL